MQKKLIFWLSDTEGEEGSKFDFCLTKDQKWADMFVKRKKNTKSTMRKKKSCVSILLVALKQPKKISK